uniref:Uncharacterized protein n=1 Tax=Leersia perrieri TaxID=77586 RepID=A0A0D9XC93_9ORYZ
MADPPPAGLCRISIISNENTRKEYCLAVDNNNNIVLLEQGACNGRELWFIVVVHPAAGFNPALADRTVIIFNRFGYPLLRVDRNDSGSFVVVSSSPGIFQQINNNHEMEWTVRQIDDGGNSNRNANRHNHLIMLLHHRKIFLAMKPLHRQQRASEYAGSKPGWQFIRPLRERCQQSYFTQ